MGPQKDIEVVLQEASVHSGAVTGPFSICSNLEEKCFCFEAPCCSGRGALAGPGESSGFLVFFAGFCTARDRADPTPGASLNVVPRDNAENCLRGPGLNARTACAVLDFCHLGRGRG